MPKRSRMSVFCRALTFISNKFRFFASENAEFYFPFVVRSLRDEHTTNRLEAERKHHSSCLSCATKAQRMSGRIFLFPLLSLASLLSLSYAFLDNSMFSLAFWTCPPLPTNKREGGLMSLKNNLQIYTTLNFRQIHIFQFVLIPICICIILNHLSPKIMYIQRKLRWNMWNYGVYHFPKLKSLLVLKQFRTFYTLTTCYP